MCGISTLVVLSHPNAEQNGDFFNNSHHGGPEPTSHPAKQRLQDEMHESLDIIKHRGPDASGVWVSDDERIGTMHPRNIDYQRYRWTQG